jgi:hypothetical protein
LQISPTDATALFFRGSSYLASNENDKGRIDFELLINTAPHDNQLRMMALEKLESLRK